MTACLRQDTQHAFEVLVLDSGSTDGTVEIARGFGDGARLHEIPNSEFGHGRTRNLAARLTEASVLALLTQDAVPASDGWLEQLVAPFTEDPLLAATFGRQLAPAGCRPHVKRTLNETFDRLSPDGGLVVRRPSDQPSGGWFFSNVNAAYRRSVLVDQVPFRDIDYAEDMAFARDAADSGLSTAYVPAAAVVHAHDYPLRQHFARVRADTVGSWRTSGKGPATDARTTFRNGLSLARRDVCFAWADREYTRPVRLRHVLTAPVYSVAASLAYRRAGLDVRDC